MILGPVKEFWDVFDNDGVKCVMCNLVVNVDTGTCKPICCRPPYCGSHKACVMDQLVNGLESDGLVEDNDSPWGGSDSSCSQSPSVSQTLG